MTHIETMKQALKKAIRAHDEIIDELKNAALDSLTGVINDLEQAIATEESSAIQEPYGFLKLNTGRFANEVEGCNPMTDKRYLPLYTHPQPKAEQEPKREPLTDEQITAMWSQYNPLQGIASFVRAIEAAHGII